LHLPAHTQSLPAWQEVQARLRGAVGEPAYSLWLASLEVIAWNGTVLHLAAPDDKHQWLAKRFARVVASAAGAVLGQDVRVEFTGATPGTTARPEAPAVPLQPGLNPRYTFDQFVIGKANQLAHAAALAIAEAPGQAYNPLFLYAPPGLGKTHLLHAIGNYLTAFGGGATVVYTTAETFTNHFLGALASRSVDRFKHTYRNADVLLIDDVQFLASKARTEEEFFHTFNALYERGRQLVVTCDRLPARLTDVEERLRERFEAGLITEIGRPDFHTRRTILRKRAAIDGIDLADSGVLDVIASRVTSNVRALEGALVRTVAFNSLTGKPIERELATAVLDMIQPRTRPTEVSVAGVQAMVAAHHDLTAEDLKASTRAARVAVPRQIAMYLAREVTGASLHEIGAAFGGRTHTTVLHACAQIKQRVAREEAFATHVSVLRALISTSEEIDRDD
jgi:chromosomal replication initiator protein